VDFSNAFDSLNQQKLLSILENMGIRGHAHEWFKSYFTNRRYVVKIKDELSSEKIMKRGAPQGSVLGPKLYNCYINDIIHCFTKCKFFMYADDLAILSVHKNQKIYCRKFARRI